jgi:hypothetical protein
VTSENKIGKQKEETHSSCARKQTPMLFFQCSKSNTQLHTFPRNCISNRGTRHVKKMEDSRLLRSEAFQVLMVLRKEFQGVQPEKNPHRDVTGGGKKEKKKKMWEENCKTLEILNPRISETIILNPRIQKPEPKLTHSGKKTETQKKKGKKKVASREKIYHQPTWNIETLLSAAPVPRKALRNRRIAGDSHPSRKNLNAIPRTLADRREERTKPFSVLSFPRVVDESLYTSTTIRTVIFGSTSFIHQVLIYQGKLVVPQTIFSHILR